MISGPGHALGRPAELANVSHGHRGVTEITDRPALGYRFFQRDHLLVANVLPQQPGESAVRPGMRVGPQKYTLWRQ